MTTEQKYLNAQKTCRYFKNPMIILFFMSIDTAKSNVIKLWQVRFTLKQRKFFNEQGVTGRDLLPEAVVKCPLTGRLQKRLNTYLPR